MERKDLLQANGAIFTTQGKALNERAASGVKVLVVGNPANTNCLIAMRNAPDIAPEQFSAMTRLDHNRALSQLADKTSSPVADVKRMIIWGNHSSTQVPDLTHATVAGRPARDLVDDEWVTNEFIPTVQRRGAAIIDARGASSAASAANAAIDHMRSWAIGTPEGDWVSMAVPTAAVGHAYGVQGDLVYSYPVTISAGGPTVVEGLEVGEAVRERMKASEAELLEERSAVEDLLG